MVFKMSWCFGRVQEPEPDNEPGERGGGGEGEGEAAGEGETRHGATDQRSQ